MKWSEILTIYFAAGISFGVAAYLGHEGRPLPALLKAFSVTISWPLALFRLFWRAGKRNEAVTETPQSSLAPAAERQIWARSQVELALAQVTDLSTAVFGSANNLETTIESVRSTLEEHFHLTLALHQMTGEEEPQPRAVELCRVAGREGADLQVAAHCLHRRGVAHLKARCARSGIDFVHALAALHEAIDPARTVPLANLVALRQLSEALLRLDGTAIELLSRLEDENAARSVARLLDAECARVRRLKALGPQPNLTDNAGGAAWQPPPSRPTLVPPETTLSPG